VPFVVDASVALAWHFEDEASPYADEVLERLITDEAVVPALWPHEVANGLVLGQKRDRISEAGVAEAIARTLDFNISVRAEAIESVFGAIMDLAVTHGLTVYDACYLHLAMVEGLPLATQDTYLRAAAETAGVPLA
jgi:predicted nucleic acid-binding protein